MKIERVYESSEELLAWIFWQHWPNDCIIITVEKSDEKDCT
jgi:hypothetical protein